MLTIFNRKAVFTSLESGQVAAVTQALHDARIGTSMKYKSKAMPGIFGNRGSVGLDPLNARQSKTMTRVTYTVFVHKKDLDLAASIVPHALQSER